MAVMVIATFKPKPGKQDALRANVREHHGYLKNLDLVTDRPAYAMESADGTIIEVFEWKSQDAINKAHTMPEVHALWARFEDCCEYLSPNQVPECSQMFPGFKPLW
jgi:quinol monooxygenase YgiN